MTVSNLTRCQTILAIAACLFAALAFASCGDQEGSRPADTESTDAGNMDQLLFFVTRGHESAVFDKAAGMEPRSVFCSDMIDELTVTESTPVGSGCRAIPSPN